MSSELIIINTPLSFKAMGNVNESASGSRSAAQCSIVTEVIASLGPSLPPAVAQAPLSVTFSHRTIFFFFFGVCTRDRGVLGRGGVTENNAPFDASHPLCLLNEGQLASGRQTEGEIREERANGPKMRE